MPARGTRRAVAAREAGLDTLARANRWLVGGALALAGMTSAVTWHAFQAHAAGVSRIENPVTPAAGHRHEHHSDDAEGSSSAAPVAPAAAPAASPAAPAAPAPAVSGGS
jgi:hypothetical protein